MTYVTAINEQMLDQAYPRSVITARTPRPPEKADIRGGDKLALRTIERDGKICCILLAKTDELGQAAQATLGLDEEKVLRLAGAVSSITARAVKP